MSISLLFWFLYILSVLYALWAGWPLNRGFGVTAMLFVLVGLIGWQVFGAAVHK